MLQILAQLPDFRAARGRRYPLWLVLLLVIMGTMSGCFSYCAERRFCSSSSSGITATTRAIAFELSV
ncbi:MAG: transposase family protein [Okeania sp. SIO2D1]|nr:transposase family protein [Okeania sp. SIO2D1]